MLRMSKLTDYATLVLAELARVDGAMLSSADVAARTGLTGTTVSKLLKSLTRAGLVNSQRGGIPAGAQPRTDFCRRGHRRAGRSGRHHRMQHRTRELRSGSGVSCRRRMAAYQRRDLPGAGRDQPGRTAQRSWRNADLHRPPLRYHPIRERSANRTPSPLGKNKDTGNHGHSYTGSRRFYRQEV